jgi:hypothetical protein
MKDISVNIIALWIVDIILFNVILNGVRSHGFNHLLFQWNMPSVVDIK